MQAVRTGLKTMAFLVHGTGPEQSQFKYREHETGGTLSVFLAVMYQFRKMFKLYIFQRLFLFLEFAAFPATPPGSTMFSMEPTSLKTDSGYIFYLSIEGIKQ